MKEIVVISGKGGTGKTSITAAFAYLENANAIIGDCDVDAADMHLLMKPDFKISEEFYSGELAIINQTKCIQCGKCKDICRFKAISFTNDKYVIKPIYCEGCGYCEKICSSEAIRMETQMIGHCYISTTKVNNQMVHASLGIGAENSGKLVAKVKKEANRIARQSNKEFLIIDGSPGIGCPVISSLSGANFVVLITEPSVAGIHDLKRVYEVVKKFKIKAGCIINKYDVNTEISQEIIDYLSSENIIHISNIPYNENFTKAMVNGKTIIEFDQNHLKKSLIESWEKIKKQ